jgi:type I restriction enzyme S subunit
MHALRQIEIIVPDKELLVSFSKTINPIFQKIQTNNSQIQSLSKTRDKLLPKLMSGEVRVV